MINQRIFNIMLPDCKSNFLQKKKQEKKKVEKQTIDKIKATLLQKNIQSFLARRRLYHQAIIEKNLAFSLNISSDLSAFDHQTVEAYVNRIAQEPELVRINHQKKLILAFMRSQQDWMVSKTAEIFINCAYLRQQLCKIESFAIDLQRLLVQGKGCKILELTIKELLNTGTINKISAQLLFQTALKQHAPNYFDIQGIYSYQLSHETTLLILDYLSNYAEHFNFEKQMFGPLCRLMHQTLSNLNAQINQNIIENSLAFGVWLLRRSLLARYESTIENLMIKNKELLLLIQDEEEMEYFETRMRGEDEFIQFCLQTLVYLEKIFTHPKELHALMATNALCRQNLSDLISDISRIYVARKILWVYSFLSDDNTLLSLLKEKNSEFYISLKMKLLTMDDKQFLESELFNTKEWEQIIGHAINRGFELNKILMGKEQSQKNQGYRKMIPFQQKNNEEKQLKNISEMMNNLYKKCLRTRKINEEFFINKELDKMMNSFTFGIGAKTLEMMLKSFPFAFRFSTRMKKLNEFIKEDKQNYDRTLFLQEQIDEDLIIHIRRGREFLDAFHTCLQKDMRKKYKIVFFNEQGLEEEGIDGGGIIKQFINRVLKSSFSEVFGMFYETENNEILPNPYSPSTQQYQFIGKIVGKAVYESINIEYKFAEPFLNLLIGRQNSFEDLQYIDKQIYSSLLYIKRYEGDISEMQQTFTIHDKLPNGMSKIINLLKPNSSSQEEEVLITNQNKMEYVMSYSDFKCNKQLEEKTRLFRKGFLKVMKLEWLTMFSNQELNLIISGGEPNYEIDQLKENVIFNNGYNEKSQTILDLWAVLREFTPQQKSLFLLYVTSCPRPPTLGFCTMKPLICITKSQEIDYLPTANTCMNVLRLPDYKNRENLKKKLIYAINAKAGFQFA